MQYWHGRIFPFIILFLVKYPPLLHYFYFFTTPIECDVIFPLHYANGCIDDTHYSLRIPLLHIWTLAQVMFCDTYCILIVMLSELCHIVDTVYFSDWASDKVYHRYLLPYPYTTCATIAMLLCCFCNTFVWMRCYIKSMY